MEHAYSKPTDTTLTSADQNFISTINQDAQSTTILNDTCTASQEFCSHASRVPDSFIEETASNADRREFSTYQRVCSPSIQESCSSHQESCSSHQENIISNPETSFSFDQKGKAIDFKFNVDAAKETESAGNREYNSSVHKTNSTAVEQNTSSAAYLKLSFGANKNFVYKIHESKKEIISNFEPELNSVDHQMSADRHPVRSVKTNDIFSMKQGITCISKEAICHLSPKKTIPSSINQAYENIACLNFESSANLNIEPDAFSGQDVEPIASSGPAVDPSTSSGQDVEPNVSSCQDVKPSAYSGRDIETIAFSGQDVEPTASSGQDVEPTASSGQDVEPTASSGQDAEPTASSGQDAEPTASSGQDVEPTASSGQDVEPTASSGQDVETTSSSGQDVEPTSSSGQDVETTSSSGQDVEPTSSSGQDVEPTASSGQDVETIASSGQDIEPTASSGQDVETIASCGQDVKTTASSGQDVETVASPGRDVEHNASSCQHAETIASSGQDVESNASPGQNAELAVCHRRGAEQSPAQQDPNPVASSSQYAEPAASSVQVNSDHKDRPAVDHRQDSRSSIDLNCLTIDVPYTDDPVSFCNKQRIAKKFIPETCDAVENYSCLAGKNGTCIRHSNHEVTTSKVDWVSESCPLTEPMKNLKSKLFGYLNCNPKETNPSDYRNEEQLTENSSAQTSYLSCCRNVSVSSPVPTKYISTRNSKNMASCPNSLNLIENHCSIKSNHELLDLSTGNYNEDKFEKTEYHKSAKSSSSISVSNVQEKSPEYKNDLSQAISCGRSPKSNICGRDCINNSKKNQWIDDIRNKTSADCLRDEDMKDIGKSVPSVILNPIPRGFIEDLHRTMVKSVEKLSVNIEKVPSDFHCSNDEPRDLSSNNSDKTTVRRVNRDYSLRKSSDDEERTLQIIENEESLLSEGMGEVRLTSNEVLNGVLDKKLSLKNKERPLIYMYDKVFSEPNTSNSKIFPANEERYYDVNTSNLKDDASSSRFDKSEREKMCDESKPVLPEVREHKLKSTSVVEKVESVQIDNPQMNIKPNCSLFQISPHLGSRAVSRFINYKCKIVKKKSGAVMVSKPLKLEKLGSGVNVSNSTCNRRLFEVAC